MPTTIQEDLDIHTGQQLALIVSLAQTLDLDTVRRLARADNEFDTIVAILDPTKWQQEHHAVEAASNVARSFIAFREAIDKAKAR